MQRKDLLLSVIGVVVLVFVMGLVGGCHSGRSPVGDSDGSGTWWLSEVDEGYESGALVIGADNTWTLTMRCCNGDEETSSGTWTRCEDTGEYTIMEEGQPDRQGTVANDAFTITGADDPLIFTRTQPASPCP